jgi:hypothetical protein
MKLKCESCKRIAISYRRSYTVAVAGKIKSKSELCRRCYKNIKKMI